MSRHSISTLVSEELTDVGVVRENVTMPIDISELVPVTRTIPIDVSQIMSVALEGGTRVPTRSWFGRVWDTLTRRVEPRV